MIGAIAGDIIGSAYEFGRTKSREFPLFGPDSRYTDDSVRQDGLGYGHREDGIVRISAVRAEEREFSRLGPPEFVDRPDDVSGDGTDHGSLG